MRARLVCIVAVIVLVGAACSSGSSKSSSKKSSGTTTTAAGAGASSTTAPSAAPAKIGHVFVINLENKSYDRTWGPGSKAQYLNTTLRPQGQLLTNYYAIGHVSLDNYIAQISGQSPNPNTQADCTTYVEFDQTGTGQYGQALGKGCVYPASVKTIADQLTAAGKTWKGYMEDMGNSSTEPKTCRHPAIGSHDPTVGARKGDQYATRHNPFVYFHSIVDSPSCNANDVPLDRLDTDLRSESTTPNLAYITPNLCHDGHDSPCVDGQPGGLVSADQFLSQWVPKILASPAYKADGLLVVTFDEADVGGDHGDSSACCNTPPSPNTQQPGGNGPGGGRVGALLVSASIQAGSTNQTPYNHYALLCSMENLFGLDHLGFAGAPGLQCFGKDVFNG
ncbi:MAG TPA: alkaline phosphatase family protein [Acidimicrobiia bacterium]|nr:alkaline phosphatase family protein [Acidimicrobiia bacterium]